MFRGLCGVGEAFFTVETKGHMCGTGKRERGVGVGWGGVGG